MHDRDRATSLRAFFAAYVVREGRAADPRIERAFAATAREKFAGPGPWSVQIPGSGYLLTPSDDPAFLYHDTLVALDAARSINIGHPSSHARWLDALALQEGETVVQVGVGTGYYTALLAHLVGPRGRVHAYEIDGAFAARAGRNLADVPWASVYHQSGLKGPFPRADAVYVNAGVTQPSPAWLDTLRVGGRLLFPLNAEGALGGMLWIGRPEHGPAWPARFVSRANFVPCVGGQDDESAQRLRAAFSKGGFMAVQSFRTDEPTENACWYAGAGWWLSTEGAERLRSTIDPADLAGYAGRYALTGEIALTVTPRDGRLFVQATDQGEIEVFPESRTRFFARAVAAQITFEIASDGTAAALVLHQNGRDQRAVRVA